VNNIDVEAARLVPNLLLGNTILLTNTRSYPEQLLRHGEIIDAGKLPPAGVSGQRMPPRGGTERCP